MSILNGPVRNSQLINEYVRDHFQDIFYHVDQLI